MIYNDICYFWDAQEKTPIICEDWKPIFQAALDIQFSWQIPDVELKHEQTWKQNIIKLLV